MRETTLEYMADINDMASGMAGMLGSVMVAGVGVAGGMAVVKMVDRMGRQIVPQQPRPKKRKRKR